MQSENLCQIRNQRVKMAIKSKFHQNFFHVILDGENEKKNKLRDGEVLFSE